MYTLGLSFATLVVFVALLFLAAAIVAEGAVTAAKQNTAYVAPVITRAVGIVAVGLCAGTFLIFVQYLALSFFDWDLERKSKIIVFLFGAVGLWLIMLDMAQRIIRRYYPDVVFEVGQEPTIATLGQKREGEGVMQDLF